jgi:hypothetical protein
VTAYDARVGSTDTYPEEHQTRKVRARYRYAYEHHDLRLFALELSRLDAVFGLLERMAAW